MIKLQLSGVSKSYGGLEVLSPTDMEVKEGEFVTLLGPSGSGKTTLLKMIAGITDVTQGRILIGGSDVTHVPARHRDLAMVFQNYALVGHMSVFENVAFPLKVRRLPSAEIRRKVTAALATVRLEQFAGRKPAELSGGQQQRVAIARALVYDPSLVLMDEPLGALDKRLRDQLQEEISQLHRKLGITVVYVTHDQQEAMSLSDRIVLMNHGRIEQVAAPEELYRRPDTEFAAEFLGDSNFLSGKAAGTGQSQSICLSSGEDVRAPQECVLSSGAAVKVMVRPEKIVLRPLGTCASEDLNIVPATVVERVFLGGMTRLILELADGTPVRAVSSDDMTVAEIASGTRINMGWHPKDAIIFKSAS
ncbi:ABC transporter ATP-binding protein [Mesorhizobium sp. PUT5]|uniref:ABC transporter ATP-binding protein n=1 Tax=Mesorhizobium sp. PUT5 TaxID=3454629 RepID=UPI003FA47EEC